MLKRGRSSLMLGRGMRTGSLAFLVVHRGENRGAGGRFFGLSAPMPLLEGREGEGSGQKKSWTRDEVMREEEGIDWIIKRVFESWMGSFTFFVQHRGNDGRKWSYY